ncbi:MAG TPA: hypothetical protein VFC67_00380 [Prolixibacteraceae bacterium]|nr:hypothetical protein [Prolixibacteraceae bacterium]
MKKEIWRQNWLDAIQDMTSNELQKKSWIILANNGSYWSYVNFISYYFSEMLFGFDNKYRINEEDCPSKQEYEIIKEWRHLLKNYVPPKEDDSNSTAPLNDKNGLSIFNSELIAKQKLTLVIPESDKMYLK